MKEFFDERGIRILKALDAFAQQTGAKQASIALAWLLSRPNILAPIASATTVEQLEDLFAAADLELSEEQLAELSAASAYEPVAEEAAMAGALPVE